MRASEAPSARELEMLKAALAEVDHVARQLRQLKADMESPENLEATSGAESTGDETIHAE
jgi:hypothetical protein